MNKINRDILDNYEFFEDLLSGEKIILESHIRLKSKGNNIMWLTGHSLVDHIAISEEIIFIVERSKRDSKYGLKLRCVSLTETPFFRFDSDGPAHRNDDPEIPLENQSVSTPHFNSFQKDGKSIAYKNSILSSVSESEAIATDINFGISLFCNEVNAKLTSGEHPEAIDNSPEIQFLELGQINFDNITFE